MTTFGFAKLRLLSLACACVVLSAFGRPAAGQTPATDHAGDITMFGHSFRTDANGDRVANITIHGTPGEV